MPVLNYSGLVRLHPLSLHAARSSTANQGLHFLWRKTVEITRNGMLQTRRCDCKLERVLRRSQTRQTIDQPSRKAVSGTHAVDNMCDIVLTAQQEAVPGVQAG